MNNSVTLTLPWPPSVNTYWRRGKHVTYLSAKGREFREEAKDAIYDQLGTFETIETRLRVDVYLYPPTRRKFDVDNYAKGVLDALQATAVIADDEQIDRLTLTKCECIGKPGNSVVILKEITECRS